MHYRLKPVDGSEKKHALVQPAWRSGASSVTNDRRHSAIGKPTVISNSSKQKVEGVLRDLMINSPAKAFQDENAIAPINSAVYESPVTKPIPFSSPSIDDGYATANELSASKRLSGGVDLNLSFNGYSIRKSGCWSGNSTPKYRDIPNRPSEGSIKFNSPVPTPQTSHKTEISSLRAENERLTQSLMDRDALIAAMAKDLEVNTQTHIQNEARLRVALDQAMEKLTESEAYRKAAWGEVETLHFMMELQEQRQAELEGQLSSSMMDHNDKLNEKTKKYKDNVKKMNRDHAEYEARANSMIAEMNEQMTKLQQFAMSRIEALESELMVQRRKNDALISEVDSLKRAAAEAAEAALAAAAAAGSTNDSVVDEEEEEQEEAEETEAEEQEEEVVVEEDTFREATTGSYDFPTQWASPPTKFSRRSSCVNKRRSSVMFRGSGLSGGLVSPPPAVDKRRAAACAALQEEDEEEEEEVTSDADTVVDEDREKDGEENALEGFGMEVQEVQISCESDDFGHNDLTL